MSQTVQELEAQLETTKNPIEKVDQLNTFIRSFSDIDPQKSLELSQTAYELAQKPPPYINGIYESLISLAICHMRLGQVEKALSQAMQAYAMTMAQKSVQPTAVLFALLGSLFQDLGEYKEALNYFLQALDLAEENNDHKEKINILNNLGIIYHHLNDYEQELAYYEKALKIYREVGETKMTAVLLNNMAMSHQARGELDTAVTKAKQSLKLAQQNKLPMLEANVLCTLGELYLDQNKLTEALNHLEESAQLASQLGFRWVEGYSVRKIGETLHKEGELEAALTFLQRALRLAEEVQTQSELSKCHQDLAQTYKLLGNHTKALFHFEKFHELDKKLYTEQADRNLRQLQILHETKSVQQEAQLYKQKTEELDAYARTVAHDLKQPIAAIVGYADLLPEFLPDLEPDSFPYRAFTKMGESAEQAAQIIDALLLLATVNKADVKFKLIDMDTAVNNVLSRLQDMIERYQGRLVLPEKWESALGHRPWIEEVWMNYISNALKYGGEAPTITLSCELCPDNMVRFWVKDDGPGIPHVASNQLFKEFSRLHNSDRKKSHGLGLAIVQRIIEKLGGTVGFKSEPGQGSQFFFTLPRPHNT